MNETTSIFKNYVHYRWACQERKFITPYWDPVILTHCENSYNSLWTPNILRRNSPEFEIDATQAWPSHPTYFPVAWLTSMFRILPPTTITFHIVCDRSNCGVFCLQCEDEVRAEIRPIKSSQIWAWARSGANKDNFREDIYLGKISQRTYS